MKERPEDPWQIGIDIHACNRAEALTLLAKALIDIAEGAEECSLHECDDEPWIPYMWFISRNITTNIVELREKCKKRW